VRVCVYTPVGVVTLPLYLRSSSALNNRESCNRYLKVNIEPGKYSVHRVDKSGKLNANSTVT
jgi:hypothetical protein